jgi:hypothetical protein
MPHVPNLLISLFCDFPKAIAIKEMKFKGLPLFFSELISQAMEETPGSNLVDEQRLAPGADLLFVKFQSLVVLPVGQVFPAVHRPMVRNLNDPRRRRPFARIKEGRFHKKQQEDFLAHVFGFGRISQDARRNIQHRAAVLAKKQG